MNVKKAFLTLPACSWKLLMWLNISGIWSVVTDFGRSVQFKLPLQTFGRHKLPISMTGGHSGVAKNYSQQPPSLNVTSHISVRKDRSDVWETIIPSVNQSNRDEGLFSRYQLRIIVRSFPVNWKYTNNVNVANVVYVANVVNVVKPLFPARRPLLLSSHLCPPANLLLILVSSSYSHTSYLSFFVRHRTFRPVNCTPEKCVNLQQKLNSLNQYWAYLLFWLVYLVSSAMGWCIWYMRWSIENLGWCIWYFHKQNCED